MSAVQTAEFSLRSLNDKIHPVLVRWGRWRRTGNYNLGLPSRTVIDKLSKGEIFGDGCRGGGYDPLTVNQIHIRDDLQSERVDDAFKALVPAFQIEMKSVWCFYVAELSLRRVGRELSTSRYYAEQILERGKFLIRNAWQN